MGGIDSDAALVAAVRAGSDAAFGRLVARHQGAVRGFLRRTLGGARDEADDLAQEVFVIAWRSLGSLNDAEGLRAWLCGIAWRKARDRMRGLGRSQARDGAWLEATDAPSGLAPEDRLALAKAMGALAPEVRACVALCLAEGWAHPEAAEALGLPLGTVKSHVSRGRARLLAVLTSDPGGGDGDDR